MPTANTVETYDNLVIREDLREQYSMISPEETPFQAAIGVGEDCSNTYVEWPIVDLQAPDTTNREREGRADPPTDEATLATRVGNYTQISDKIISTSHTSEAVDAAAENIQQISKQMVIKMREMKRDMEVMLTQNIAASAGAGGGSSAIRVAAGLPAWLRTNIILGAGGAAPTLSDSPNGFPNAGVTPGTPVPLTEANLNNVIEDCWNAGADPSIIMVNSNNKRVISETFVGNATRYKDAIDKRLTAAIDVYDSDFGELTVVPNRFLSLTDDDPDNYSVYVLDPEFASVRFLEAPRQKPLAETGHAHRRMLWAEYTLMVDNEAAHGAIHATTGAAPT